MPRCPDGEQVLTRHEFVVLLTGSGRSGPLLLACFDAQQTRALAAETSLAAAREEAKGLRKALTHLLDCSERVSTGFHPGMEHYFAVRDAARAALNVKETK